MPLMFYMTPGSCSTGIHILLETLELPFQVTIVNLLAGDNRKPAYLALNPRGSVPTLVRDDGSALTSFQAIALWLAKAHPRAGLLPEGVAGERAVALMDFVVNTLHGQGYTRIFTTEAYVPARLDEAEKRARSEAVRAEGRAIVGECFERIEADLADDGWAVGSSFSVADAALFYAEFWADKISLPMPPRMAAHYKRMRARPAVHLVLREEGYR
jgi:glutathione S-transferase